MGELQKHKEAEVGPGNVPQIANFKNEKIQFIGKDIQLAEINLNQTEKRIILDLNYQKICEIDEKTKKILVFIVVNNALRNMSSKMDSDDRVLLHNDFIWELDNYFKLLSIKEFETIVSDGIRNKFINTNTIGLSIVNFNIWHNAWLQQKCKHSISIADKVKKHSPDKQLPPPPITIQSVHELMKLEYQLLEQQGNAQLEISKELFNLSSNHIYRQLVKFNKIKETDYLLKEKDVNLEFRKQVNPLQKSIEQSIGEHANRKEVEAKRLVLIDYYFKNKKK